MVGIIGKYLKANQLIFLEKIISNIDYIEII